MKYHAMIGHSMLYILVLIIGQNNPQNKQNRGSDMPVPPKERWQCVKENDGIWFEEPGFYSGSTPHESTS